MSRAGAQVRVRTAAEPVNLLHLQRLYPDRYPHLLQSVAHGTPQARYDILFAFPGAALTLGASGLQLPAGITASTFLSALDQWWQREHCEWQQPALPFRGGWMLYLGYELVGEIEPGIRLPRADAALPTAFAVRVPAALIHDHGADVTYLVAEEAFSESLAQMEADVAAAATCPRAAQLPPLLEVAEDAPEQFLRGVEKIRDYVRDGDVFQVNLSRNWTLTFAEDPDPGVLYERLCATNPAPFAACCRWGHAAVISSSPERLVQVEGRKINTRPIAGTRPRGVEARSDRLHSDELLAHPKERAEHIMLIDLERNDLGRVCRPGSIEANELMVLETYAHVHHIVSNVRGELREDVTPGQVLAAVFPGGTITGCPKVRCMEIIAELEGEGRGAYTGSLGYLNRDGDMDLNILIRTMVQQGRTLRLRAGAGIVADSVPERELEETRAKAKGLLLAVAPEHLRRRKDGMA